MQATRVIKVGIDEVGPVRVLHVDRRGSCIGQGSGAGSNWWAPGTAPNRISSDEFHAMNIFWYYHVIQITRLVIRVVCRTLGLSFGTGHNPRG